MSPRKRNDPWPRPADTPLERSRHVCREYRRALLIAAPDTCALLDARATRFGQGWVCPQPHPYEPHDLLTPQLVADFWHVKTRTVDRWRELGLVPTMTPDGTRYRFADVERFLADRRTRRR